MSDKNYKDGKPLGELHICFGIVDNLWQRKIGWPGTSISIIFIRMIEKIFSVLTDFPKTRTGRILLTGLSCVIIFSIGVIVTPGFGLLGLFGIPD